MVTPSPTWVSISVLIAPMTVSLPIVVPPLSWANGSITVSRPMLTVASIRVEPGSTMVTPLRMSSSRMRRWATCWAYARSTRSSTPWVRSGSPIGCATTTRPASRMAGSTSGR